VDLHGAHDFRHTFATWLEDAGVPARVIDEVMGHEATSRAGQQRGSAMGAHYRHTTPEMAARIAAAIEQRLMVVCWRLLSRPSRPSRSAQRSECSSGHGPRFLANLWQMALRAEGEDALCLVELRGFEPLTPCMPLTSQPFTPQRVSTPRLLSALVSRQISTR
jgi:Phage integrase family